MKHNISPGEMMLFFNPASTGKKKKPKPPPPSSGASFRRILCRFMVMILLMTVGTTFLQVATMKYIAPPVTVPMVWEWTRHKLWNDRYEPKFYEWRDIDQISQHLQQAVLAAEDQRFAGHHGFDFIELKIALKEHMETKRVRGASTITMQTARSVFLIPARTVLRKAAEAWYTLFMELMWDKKRIIEMYLNTVDWGHGLIGAQAAAIRYFHCTAGELNRSQSALLAAILPNPHRWSPVRPSAHVRSRQSRILKQMPLMPIFK